MLVRRVIYAFALLLFAAAPAHAAGTTGTGGASAPETGGGVVTVTDGSFSLSTRAGALLGRTASFRGTVPSDDAGRTLTVERYDELTAQWFPAATATVAGDGSFVARWRTDRAGRLRIRARVDSAPGGAQAASASPELAMTVYKPATATWYGPRFYGRRTACGQRMTRTPARRRAQEAAVRHAGRRLLQGPHASPCRSSTAGRSARTRTWDLTSATAQAHRLHVHGTIGTVRVPSGRRPRRPATSSRGSRPSAR